MSKKEFKWIPIKKEKPKEFKSVLLHCYYSDSVDYYVVGWRDNDGYESHMREEFSTEWHSNVISWCDIYPDDTITY
jgi:hypothetical protein